MLITFSSVQREDYGERRRTTTNVELRGANQLFMPRNRASKTNILGVSSQRNQTNDRSPKGTKQYDTTSGLILGESSQTYQFVILTQSLILNCALSAQKKV